MITTCGPAALDERDRTGAVGGLADHPDVRRAREREAQALAHDLVVIDDQACDLFGHRRELYVANPALTRAARAEPARRRWHELDACGGRERRARGRARGRAPHRLGLGAGEVRAAGVQPLVPLELLRPVPGERLEEVLARAGTQVEQVRPDARGAGLARGPDDLGELLGPVGEPGKDRRHADARLDAGVDERRQSARRRWRGGAVPGSVVRQTSASSVGTENVTETVARRAASASTSTSRTISGPRVMIENGCRRPAEHLDARPRQPVSALGRLVRIGRGADRDRLAAARTAARARAASTSATFTLTRIERP